MAAKQPLSQEMNAAKQVEEDQKIEPVIAAAQVIDTPKRVNPHLQGNATVECENGKYADMTFVVGTDKEKKEFRGIKGIFSKQCPYFAKVFFAHLDDEKAEQVVNKMDKYVENDVNITPDSFMFIQQYLYRLHPQITVKNVIDISYTAKRYGLDELVKDCQQFIESIYSKSKSASNKEQDANFVHILSFEARALHFKMDNGHPIRRRFQTWISVEKSETIIRSTAFLSAPKEVIIEIIQNDSFSVEEEIIWSRCTKWCETHMNGNEFKQFMATEGDETKECIITANDLMRDHFVKHIRFGLMSKEFFVQNVYSSQILPIEESMKISLYFMDSSHKIGYNMRQRHRVLYSQYKCAEVLQYTFGMSGNDGSLDKVQYNTYEAITNNNLNYGVVTSFGSNKAFVSATFNCRKHVIRMEIGGMNFNNHNIEYLNGKRIQYMDPSGNWQDWQPVEGLVEEQISVVDVNIFTNAMRIFDGYALPDEIGDAMGNYDESECGIAIGCLRFHGYDA